MNQTQNPARRHQRCLSSAVLLAVLAAPAFVGPAVPTGPVITTDDNTWQYLDDGTDPVAGSTDLGAWTTPVFNDTA